ncbi:prepilin peptidase [Symbioplanes lichenis]|uniref:prepilin peptidase n=1 Tax=Symbioplanes lichenis TaxID=1629072 RepID=UPI0027392F1C|nr:prepilin peptidase [Actinoplanes lichenis]
MSLPLVIGAAVFGGAAAAFVPRVAHRLAVPRHAPVRAACAHCHTPTPSWVRAGASCSCREAPVWTVSAGALTASALAAALGASPLLVVLLPATVLGVLLAVVDVRCRRLPDRLVALLALLTSPLAALAPGDVPRALLAAALTGTAYLMIALLPGRGLGLGDVKLATVLGFVLGFAGWPAVAVGLIAPHLINGPIAVGLWITRRVRSLPFGPALLAGAVVGLAV